MEQVKDSMTGGGVWVNKLTPQQEARNIAIEIRDRMEYTQAFGASQDDKAILGKLDKIINLL